MTGQDGSYLAEQLLEKDYKVFGLVRRSSANNTWRINHIEDRVELVLGDMIDQASLDMHIKMIQPNEVYNMAAQSFVSASWKSPISTFAINALGFVKLLEAVKNVGRPDTKIYQASSSEQFGKVRETPQNEKTPFYPRSVYGVSKCAAHYIAVNYRESHNMFITCGMSFNHESPRRGLEFVSRKIARGVASIYLKKTDYIELGNLDAKRDFGYAPEYTEAMWKMMQLKEPGDYVLATGETHSIEEFVQKAFESVEIYDWQSRVKKNPKYMRPAEVDYLLGDSRKAAKEIGWSPQTSFMDLVSILIRAEIKVLDA